MSNWINADHMLPELDRARVLVACKGGRVEVTLYHSDPEYFRVIYLGQDPVGASAHFELSYRAGCAVMYWQALPPPPADCEYQ